MNRQHLEAVLQKYAGRWRKMAARIPGSFDPEDIHDLRVAYKRMRAFARLLDHDSEGRFRLPAAWKKIYRRAGIVRELQLFLPAIEDIFDTQSPEWMTRQRQLFRAKERLLAVLEKEHPDKSIDKLISLLPASLSDEGTARFTHLKIAALRIQILGLYADKDLHEARKLIKDLLYISSVFTDEWGIPFPIPVWKSDKALHELADRLGNFNDLCRNLNLEEDDLIDETDPFEKDKLLQRRGEWLLQKQEQKQALINQLKELSLNSNF